MGIACSLQRDNNGNVISALTSSGEKSILFEEAHKISEQAVDIFAVADTPIFKNEVEEPLKSTHRSRIYSRLNSLQPKTETIGEIDLNDLSIEQINTKNRTTFVASANNVVLGKLRLKKYKDGVAADTITLSPIEGLKGQGIGTEIYKEAIIAAISQEMNFYSDSGHSEGDLGVWKKFQSLGIVVNDGRRFKIPAFPEQFYDNGEPTVETVLDFIERKNTPEGLDEFEQADLKVAMVTTNLNNSDDLLRALNTGFPSTGATQSTLTQSGIYTPQEIKNILENPEIEKNIHSLIQKLSNTDVIIDNDIYVEDLFRTTSTFTSNVLGKMAQDNPFLNEKEALNQIGGYKTVEQFEQALEESDLEYLKSEDVGDLFDRFSRYNRIPVKEINGDVLSDAPVADTLDTLETYLQYPENNALMVRLKGLQISKSVWETSPQEINTLLKSLNNEAANIGLDFTTIQDLYGVKSYEEFQTLFADLQNMIQIPSQENLENFSRSYDEFFETDLNPKIEVRKVEPQFRNKSLVEINTQETAYETFARFGVLPVKDNIYQKTDALRQDLETVYDKVYQAEILPREAYGLTPVDEDGGFNRQKYLANKPQIIQSIKDWTRSRTNQIEVPQDFDSEVLEKMILYSSYFGNPLNNNQKPQEKMPVRDYIRMLKEKNKNSLAYKDFYSNFAAGNNDPISLAKMQPYMNEIQNTEEVIEDNNYLRQVYLRDPKQLPMYTGIYQNLQNGLVLLQSKNPFIRINITAYELIKTKGNHSFYTPISDSVPNPGTYNLDAYNYLIDSVSPQIELRKEYSKDTLNC